MPAVRIARVTADPLDVAAHLDAVEGPTVGAVTSFVGTVRDHDPDAAGAVAALEYSAHPDAERILGELAARAADGTGAAIAASHRVGRLAVGEVAVVVAVGAAHRDEAFEVCRAAVESIKHGLPVWKRQVEADGATAWKGLGG